MSPEPILSHVLPVERVIGSSPLVCAGLFRCEPHDPIFPGGDPCSSFCIVFPREAAWIQHEGGPRFVADSSVATLYNQGQVYRRWKVGNRPDRCDWLAFRSDVVREAVRACNGHDADHPTSPLRFGFAPVSAAVYTEQRRLFEDLATGRSPGSLEMEEHALGLLQAVVKSAYGVSRLSELSRPVSTRARESVEYVRQIIARRPEDRSTLAELATAVHLSPFHLCREFHAATGMTISSYRTELRLRGSLERIAAGDDLTTIALAQGFVSHSHFTHAFRRHFGSPPSSFRATR